MDDLVSVRVSIRVDGLSEIRDLSVELRVRADGDTEASLRFSEGAPTVASDRARVVAGDSWLRLARTFLIRRLDS